MEPTFHTLLAFLSEHVRAVRRRPPRVGLAVTAFGVFRRFFYTPLPVKGIKSWCAHDHFQLVFGPVSQPDADAGKLGYDTIVDVHNADLVAVELIVTALVARGTRNVQFRCRQSPFPFMISYNLRDCLSLIKSHAVSTGALVDGACRSGVCVKDRSVPRVTINHKMRVTHGFRAPISPRGFSRNPSSPDRFHVSQAML